MANRRIIEKGWNGFGCIVATPGGPAALGETGQAPAQFLGTAAFWKAPGRGGFVRYHDAGACHSREHAGRVPAPPGGELDWFRRPMGERQRGLFLAVHKR